MWTFFRALTREFSYTEEKVNYFLTEEQQMIKDLAAQIAKEKIEPIALEYDENQIFPHEIVEILGKSDLFRVCLLYTSPSPRDRQKSRMPSSA